MLEAKDESCLASTKEKGCLNLVSLWIFEIGPHLPRNITIEAFLMLCEVMAQVALLKVHFSEIKHQTSKASEQS